MSFTRDGMQLIQEAANRHGSSVPVRAQSPLMASTSLRARHRHHIGERTLTAHAPKTRRHSSQLRSVRLLTPLVQELREWPLMSGRPTKQCP
jgi:hypothetical protein